MKIIVAIDSLKGCLPSVEANEAARRGILAVHPEAQIHSLPVSDGGEGFLTAMQSTGSYERIAVDVCDPLMRPLRAHYLLSADVAVVEMAQANGLALLRPAELAPLRASSYGTGQLVADAVRRGARHVVVGLGGSATSDTGHGLLQALGDAFGSLDALRSVRFTIATDVTNPLLGPDGATYVFAPQKGATPDMLPLLEARAAAFAQESARRTGLDCSKWQGAGAAGGLGYAFFQYLRARRVSGIDYLLDAADFDRLLSRASLVVTGEGRADRQTLMGKLPMGILRRAQCRGVDVWLVAGQVAEPDALRAAGFARVCCFNPPHTPLADALNPATAQNNLRNCLAVQMEMPNFEQ